MAAKSLLLPKPRGKKKHSKTSWSSLLSFRTAWSFSPLQNHMDLYLSACFRASWFSHLLQSCVVSSPFTLEPRGLLFPSPKPFGPPYYYGAAWSLLSPPKPCGPPYYFGAAWSLSSMAAGPRFKSQCPSSFAAPFLTPPTVSYTCQHPCILPALLGCHSKSGQVWPHGMEPIISTLSRRPCNQGELLPSPILGGIWSHPPGSKHGHSYLTHP